MPNSGEKLSVLGFGCMRLPAPGGRKVTILSAIDKERAANQIRYAIDRGVNYLDTAYPYHAGSSESFLGEYVLKDGCREKVNIATKLPCMSINKKENIEEIFNRQLQNLHVDYIDYYLLHSLTGALWDKMLSFGIRDFMDKIRKQGKVRHMGFSFHDAKDEFIRIVDGYNWEFAQVQFNILDEHAQAGIAGIKYAHAQGLGIIVMEPLRGGALARQAPKEAQKIYDGAPVKRSPADWALRWVWDHPEITVVLSGMNNEDNIRENISIAQDALPNSLSESEISVIDNFRKIYLRSMRVGCTGCAYCMPCPTGINIPSAFLNLNSYAMGVKLEARMMQAINACIQTKDGKPHWTKACLNCGQCEKKCPQGIKIRETFKLVQKDLEGPGIRLLANIARGVMNRRKSG
jgi:predicted aldo/keto reductase-like oxidoreductase